MVYMQLMSKRDYTICCVCETHYTCLRSKKPHETHINWRQLARNAYTGFQHKVVSNIWKSKLKWIQPYESEIMPFVNHIYV